MTPLDLIRLAMKTSSVEGVGQTPDSEDVNDVFTVLNAMLGTWNRKRWLIYNLIDLPLVSTGAQSYSVGNGGAFNITRPDRIEAAYVRLLPTVGTQTIDVPLAIIEAHEDYSALTMKNLTSWPMAVFYDSNWPLGLAYIYPMPAAGSFEIHLVIKDTITQFANLTTAISLPPEYTEALLWNLSARIRPMFGLPPEPTITALATASLNTIRVANSQIPRLTLPAEMITNGAGNWAGHGIANWASLS
jgi:hypothetical protein